MEMNEIEMDVTLIVKLNMAGIVFNLFRSHCATYDRMQLCLSIKLTIKITCSTFVSHRKWT